MRSAILLLVLSAVILGSCTSAYKTGQTPDDVYFSPERPQDKYVTVREDDNSQYLGDDYYDDQYLRMKVHNRMMWSELDDPYFYNPRYSYGYSYYNNWANPWSPYTSWNYYYNPYCSPVVYTPKTGMAYNHPRVFNLNTYNGTQLTNNNYTKGSSLNSNNYNSKPVRIVGYSPNNNNSSSGAGNFLRNIFNGSSNNSSNSSSNSNSSLGSGSRSSGGSSGSSGSSGGGGGSAPARRF